jgi:bacteriocin biosynthesis cyclodehydratase domain-containing protein
MITLTEGRFGEAVGGIVEKMIGARRAPLSSAIRDFPRLLSNEDFVAVASFRRSDSEFDKLDDACFAATVRWCAVYPSEDRLICGPFIAPGSGPCFRCFLRRYLCHHPAPERELCLQRAYERDPNLGPQGFLAQTAWIAASMLVATAGMNQAEGGRLLEINLFDADFLHTRVIPVHNCSRCRRHPLLTRNGDRFVNRLVPSIQDLLG